MTGIKTKEMDDNV